MAVRFVIAAGPPGHTLPSKDPHLWLHMSLWPELLSKGFTPLLIRSPAKEGNSRGNWVQFVHLPASTLLRAVCLTGTLHSLTCGRGRVI